MPAAQSLAHGEAAGQLRSAWTDTWEDATNPDPLLMLLQVKSVRTVMQELAFGYAGTMERLDEFAEDRRMCSGSWRGCMLAPPR